MVSQAVTEYLYQIQSQGRYSFSLQELRDKFRENDKAILQKLHRLKRDNRIAQVRKEFFVIIPPEYSHQGILPTSYYLDDMMKFLERDYYLGLFSAAALHGAGHQQPMESQIIIHKPPIRTVKNKQQQLTFFIKNSWERDWLNKVKTDAGYVLISSPELTIIDLIHYHKQIGGLNRVIPIIEELIENLKPSKLNGIAKEISTPTIQRLGYILDKIGETKLSELLLKIIENKANKMAKLSLAHNTSKGIRNSKWNLIINTEIDL